MDVQSVCGDGKVPDMYERWPGEVRRGGGVPESHDDQTWKRLEPQLVEQGERVELYCFKKMGIYECVYRETARRDSSWEDCQSEAAQG